MTIPPRWEAVLAAAADGLLRHRLRAALSVTGIVVGIASVVAMMAIVDGARADALRRLEHLGVDTIIVRHLDDVRFGPGAVQRGLNLADLDRLTRLTPGVEASAALVERTLPVTTRRTSQRRAVLGVTADFFKVVDAPIDPLVGGRGLGALDGTRRQRVAVAGGAYAGEAFGAPLPGRSELRLASDSYTLVGVLRGRGRAAADSPAAEDLDRSLIVPLATLRGEADLQTTHVDEIRLRMRDAGAVTAAIPRVRDTLLTAGHRRGLANFTLVVPLELLEARLQAQRGYTIVLAVVAALALLTGALGVTNVMLTSAIERSTEIGLRRAVGARRLDIGAQFLAESALLTAAGGTIGALAGIAGVVALRATTAVPAAVSLRGLAVATVVTAATGLACGISPARRAAARQPVEALRSNE
jgi:putative ABC transport system permease protein